MTLSLKLLFSSNNTLNTLRDKCKEKGLINSQSFVLNLRFVFLCNTITYFVVSDLHCKVVVMVCKSSILVRQRNPIMFAQMINTCSVQEGLIQCHSAIQCELFQTGFTGFFEQGD